MGISEFRFIDWIRSVTPGSDRVPIGPGDDCALVRMDGRDVLITIDQIAEGVHFDGADCAEATLARIGRKAVASAISDIAAMAGEPRAVVASVLLRSGLAEDDLRAMYLAMREATESAGAAFVGGDIAAGGERLVISVAVMGEPHAKGAVTRSGAEAGDAIFVTGALGGSLRGRHLDVTPRVAEARELIEAVTLHAMIDVSDGLAQDLGHILTESGRGAVLNADAIPIHDDARAAAVESGRDALDHALNDGEDFELVFTVPADEADRVPPTLAAGVTVSRIGVITEQPGLLIEVEGERRPLAPGGWVHETA